MVAVLRLRRGFGGEEGVEHLLQPILAVAVRQVDVAGLIPAGGREPFERVSMRNAVLAVPEMTKRSAVTRSKKSCVVLWLLPWCCTFSRST